MHERKVCNSLFFHVQNKMNMHSFIYRHDSVFPPIGTSIKLSSRWYECMLCKNAWATTILPYLISIKVEINERFVLYNCYSFMATTKKWAKKDLTYRKTINGPIQITSHAAIVPSIHCVRCSRDASVCASYKSYERRL